MLHFDGGWGSCCSCKGMLLSFKFPLKFCQVLVWASHGYCQAMAALCNRRCWKHEYFQSLLLVTDSMLRTAFSGWMHWMCELTEVGFALNFLIRRRVHCILVPLQSFALGFLLHSGAYLTVTKICYFLFVAELHVDFEVYFRQIYKSIC